MPSLADPTTWREYRYQRGYLWFNRPQPVFKALVTVASYTPIYPITWLGWDNDTLGNYITDITPGMTVTLGSTDEGNEYGQTMALGAALNILYVPRTSKGHEDGELELIENAYLTVWDDFRLWPLIPLIADDGTIAKAGVWDYATYGSPPPVPILGRGLATIGFVDAGTGLLTVSLNGASSYSTDPDHTSYDYLWDVGDGTITVGHDYDANITATFPAGERWITLRVGDYPGPVYYYRRHLVVACNRSGANSPIKQFEVTGLNHTAGGKAPSFIIHEDAPYTEYLDGAAIVYFEEECYGDPLDPDNYSVTSMPATLGQVKFAGWHSIDHESIIAGPGGRIAELRVDCVDAAKRLAQLPAFPQLLERESTPASWYDLEAANIDRFLHHLLCFHSTAINLTDFVWSGVGSTYPFSRLSGRGSNLYDQIDGRAQAIGYNLNCDRLGRLLVKPDNMLLASGSRGSTIQATLSDADIASIQYSRIRPPRNHWLKGSAIIADDTDAADLTANDIQAVFCVAPGETPGFGTSSATHGESLVVNQAELNIREGNRYAARLNADLSMFEVELTVGGDAGFDPAYTDEWIRLSISAAMAAQRGLTFTNARFMVHEVNWAYLRHGLRRQTLVLEKESEGVPAATYYPPSAAAGGGTYIPPSETYPIPDYNVDPNSLHTLPGQLDRLAMVDHSGNLLTTSNFLASEASGGPDWASESLGAIGTVLNGFADAFSYTDGSGVDLILATTTGIWLVEDTGGANTVSQLYTWPFTYSTQDRINIDGSFTEQGFILAVVSDADGGTKAYYSTDRTNFTESTITTYNETNAGFSHMPMLAISNLAAGYAISSAFSASGNGTAPQAIYETPDYGATWAAYSGGVTFSTLHGLGGSLEIPFHDNASQLVIFYGRKYVTDVGAGRQTLQTWRSVGATATDITPIISGHYGMPRVGRWGIKTCPVNRHRVIAACNFDKPDASSYGYHAITVSEDDGDTWTQITVLSKPESAGYNYGAISGDNEDILYLWGGTGRIAYSENFGATLQDKRGDMLTAYPSTGNIIMIAGLL